jgi:hypothetical protein
MGIKLLKLAVFAAVAFLLINCAHDKASGNGAAEDIAGQDRNGNIIPVDSVHKNDSAFPVHQ